VSSRAGIHYWKCDRPAALHGTVRAATGRAPRELMLSLAHELERKLGGPEWRLAPASGQGNHLTFRAESGTRAYFLRVEDGPEADDYMAVESELLRRLRAQGIPVPAVHYCDASRTALPVAFHLLDLVPASDLNTHLKSGRLDLPALLAQIGHWIACWQKRVPVEGFGPFDRATLEAEGRLRGLHATAVDYFYLNLPRHLDFLAGRGFIPRGEAAALLELLEGQRGKLGGLPPCLVHKDMALWNVLGTGEAVSAFIDWDDAIGGDPMEDLALLGCFHPAGAVASALDAYAAVSDLPPDHMRRFYGHLLRNMIVKAVIRVGAGYFDGAGGSFLHGAGVDGEALREFTLARLRGAARALREGRDRVDFG
jgi:aminoglycoside phosphotransferase (APT) family kinase protein